jgi:hypothetical protein
MRRPRDRATRQGGLKLWACFQTLHDGQTPALNAQSDHGPQPDGRMGIKAPVLDSQTLATLGAACIDHGATATGLHANQKAVGTGATCLGWLVGAFHNSSFVPRAMNQLWAKPKIIANFRKPGK